MRWCGLSTGSKQSTLSDSDTIRVNRVNSTRTFFNMATTLTKGRKYSDADLDFAGWTASDVAVEGYHWMDYFDDASTYLGPDDFGIEPLFERDCPLRTAELVVTITEDSMGDGCNSQQAAAETFAEYIETELPAFFADIDLTVTVQIRENTTAEIWSDCDEINGDSRFDIHHISENLTDLWESWIRTPDAMTV